MMTGIPILVVLILAEQIGKVSPDTSGPSHSRPTQLDTLLSLNHSNRNTNRMQHWVT